MIPEIKEADKIIDELNNINAEQVEMLRTKLTNCTSNISDISVQGGRKLHTREDALLLLADMTSMLDRVDEMIHRIYNKITDRDLKIYFDKKYFRLSNAQLETKWGIGKRQINKICKKIEKIHKSSP